MQEYVVEETNSDISSFLDAVFDEQYERIFRKEKDKSQNGHLQFVIKEGEKIVAAVLCQRRYQALKISDLAVAYSHQKQRLGSLILNYLKEYAQQKGILTILLTTRSYQAKDFYLKNGFEVIGQVENCPFPDVSTYYLVYYI